MTEKQKIVLLAACSTLAALSWFSSTLSLLPRAMSDILSLVAAVLGVAFIGHSALKSLLEGVFGIDLLATTAIVASIVVGEYLAAAVVVLMLGGGEVLEDYAFKRASRAIEKLIEASPKTAVVLRDGEEVEVRVEDVELGEAVLVRPGGMIPVDGAVLKGRATVNQSSVTGESMPVEKSEGDQVYCGTMVELGALEIRVTAVGEGSTYGRIVSMVREAEENRAPIERTADKYAKYFTPLILSLGIGVFLFTRNPLRIASIFVIACPCALTLATPTAMVASMGNFARKGILIRNGESLEKLSGVDVLVLDKTGTITTGRPEVDDVRVLGDRSEHEVVRLAATAERRSEHPLAQAVLKKANDLGIKPEDWTDFKVHPGLGVRVEKEESSITVGNEKMLKEYSIPLSDEAIEYLTEQQAAKTVMLVAEGEKVIGALTVSDVLRNDVKDVLTEVRMSGGMKTIMLTGDNAHVAKMVGEQAGVDEIVADLMPHEKVEYICGLKAKGHGVAMVGDGINDAPALAIADVGIAMGLSGADVSIETAGITLATDDLGKLPKLLRISRETMKIIKQNIMFAMAVNLLGVILSIYGFIPPLMASVIHESNALLVMVNSLRLLRLD